MPRPPRRRRRLVVAVLVAALAAGATFAVLRLHRSEPSPVPAAQALAAALTSGRLAAAGFENATAGELRSTWTRLSAGMAGAEATVRLVRVHAAGGRAPARLRWAWQLAPRRTWSYTTTATLVLHDGAWAPVWSPGLVHPALRAGETLSLAVTQARRGAILDGDGRPLIVPREVVNVGVEPDRVRQLGRLAATLHRVPGIDAAALVRAVRAAPANAFVPVITLRRGDYEQVRGEIYPLPGTVFTTATVPLAPTRSFARTLIGVTGRPTADQVRRSHGRLSAGATVGLSGLEQAFDARLAGTPGLRVRVLDRKGHARRTLFSIAPAAGRPLAATLDVAAQQAADAALAGTTRPSALVVLRVSTGAVIASAVGPDPGGYDIAFQGEYPPGSTFKVVTALALLERGEQAGDPVDCPAELVFDGRSFRNAEHEVLGSIDFARAFAASCNTAFVGLAAKVPGSILPATARTLGIGAPLALGVGAFSGVVPLPHDAVDLAAEAFGQGRILVSPLALAAAAAAVARGRYVPPYVVNGTGGPASPPLPAGPVATLRSLMRAVVLDGTATVLASQPGLPVYGKTGTAETGTATPPLTDAWFVGWQGDVAFACLVANTKNGFGGTLAAPIVGRFLAALRPR